MSEYERIPVLKDGREVSHLSARLMAPRGEVAPKACFVFLHGFGSDQEGEKAVFFREAALSRGLAYCSFDFQGHGASGGTMRELTISRNLADLALMQKFLKDAGHERLILAGSSMGGFTAVWYAALHPEGIAAGCHIAPAFGMQEGFLAWAGKDGARKWEEEGVTRFNNGFVDTDLGWGWITDLKSLETTRLLPIYKTPTLILQGKKDESVPWRNVVNFAAGCEYEGIDLHLFADGDHRMTDRKERLWALMVEFLEGRGIL